MTGQTTISKLSHAACVHCGADVPAGMIDPRSKEQFCCHGCESAYRVLSGMGRRPDVGPTSESAACPLPIDASTAGSNTSGTYRIFDDPAFASLYTRPHADGTLEAELLVEGMHCASCVRAIESLPRRVPGVVEARVDFRRSVVRTRWQPQRVALSRIADELDSLGFKPHPAREGAARAAKTNQDRKFLVRLAVAGACTANVMLLFLALYAGIFADIEHEFESMFRWLSMALGVLCLAWPGQEFFRNAWTSIRTRTPHLDLPISIALAVGGLCGTINVLRGTGHLYFDSLTGLVFLLLVGRWIQRRQQRWAADAVELLFSLTPTSTRRLLASGEVEEVSIQAVQKGDTLAVRAGDSIPADGTIVLGQSQVDQSLLTGESRPVRVGIGDSVAAGSVNLQAVVHVQVEATGEETRVGKLMKLVAEAAERKAPIVRMADRLAGAFVLGMVGLAAACVIVWLFIDPSRAIDNATALLIVSCPCALGLATPLAISVAVGRAAKQGIFVKGGDALELLTKPGTLFLDKTGTITRGRMGLVRWIGDERVKPLVRAIEQQSSHPIAAALVTALPAGEFSSVRAEQTVGAGIAGTVDACHVLAGSVAFVAAKLSLEPSELPSWSVDAIESCTRELLTPILIAVDGQLVAIAALGDPVRADAQASINEFVRRGWRVEMLSGDHSDVARAVGRSVGLSPERCRGALSPEDKRAIVQDAAKLGTVVMVGDGVNDAAALSAATIGIAVHGGAEASLSAADIYLNTPGLAPIVSLTTAAERTLSAIRRCLVASVFYNVLASALALLGLINPLLAAILMPLSSLTVLTLSFKVRTFGNELAPDAQDVPSPVRLATGR